MQIEFSIVGSKYHEGALDYLMNARIGKKLYLEREPDNNHDRNAIAVYSSAPNTVRIKLGYIPAIDAAYLAPQFDAHIVDRVCIFRGYFGSGSKILVRANMPIMLLQEINEKADYIGDGQAVIDSDVLEQIPDVLEQYAKAYPLWSSYHDNKED